MSLSSLVEGDEGCIGPSGKLLCSWKPQKIMQHIHGDIPLLFDFRTNPIVLLLLPKSSTSGWTVSTEFFSKKNILAIAENTWWAFLSQF